MFKKDLRESDWMNFRRFEDELIVVYLIEFGGE